MKRDAEFELEEDKELARKGDSGKNNCQGK